MELREIEENIRAEAASLASGNRELTDEEISERLLRIADQIAFIRNEHGGGIDASMGKRSGLKVDI